MKKLIPAVLLMVTVFVGALQAQNLLDNEAYKKAVQLRDQAQQAFAGGQYDQATKLSKQAETYAKQAVQIAQQLALGYRATNLLNIAKARVNYGESIKAPSRYPTEWKTAQEQLPIAQKNYDAKAYTESMVASRAVIAALKNIQPEVAGVTPAAPSGQKVLPAYYTVRLLPNHRDCFWRIAGYPFVYDNPLKWTILYEANKQVLQDPSNPNLIQPGMVFRIPSINGEKREGMYKP